MRDARKPVSPCPICGMAPFVALSMPEDRFVNGKYSVFCCGDSDSWANIHCSTMEYETEEEAIDSWNSKILL
jgi:hypothetical protein